MALAVGIPVRERPYTLACCLSALFAQSLLPDFIFIVDQSSVSMPLPRELALMLRAWSFLPTELHYVPTGVRKGIWSARLQIVRMASKVADTLLFLDSDMVLAAGAVGALWAALYELPTKFVMGTQVSAELEQQGWSESSELARSMPGSDYHWYRGGTAPFASAEFCTRFVMLRMRLASETLEAIAHVAEKFQRADGSLVVSDDYLMRAYLTTKGHKGVIVPAAKAVHVAPDSGEVAWAKDRLEWLNRKAGREIEHRYSNQSGAP